MDDNRLASKQKVLTVGELREKLKDIPDDVKVVLESDSGVEQSGGDNVVIITDAFYHNYKLPDGKVFADTGENEVKEFWIYCNYYEDDFNE